MMNNSEAQRGSSPSRVVGISALSVVAFALIGGVIGSIQASDTHNWMFLVMGTIGGVGAIAAGGYARQWHRVPVPALAGFLLFVVGFILMLDIVMWAGWAGFAVGLIAHTLHTERKAAAARR